MSILKSARCSIAGCARKHYAHRLCNLHYQRQYKYGSLELQRPQGNTPFAQRLKSCVRKANGCIEWVGGRTGYGYGQLKEGRRTRLAHRVAWELRYGLIPTELCVLHRCDNPACVNVQHLFVGTHKDNTADMIAKGRRKQGNQKLIRFRGEVRNVTQWALVLGISRSALEERLQKWPKTRALTK